jgi:hypothetical protein
MAKRRLDHGFIFVVDPLWWRRCVHPPRARNSRSIHGYEKLENKLQVYMFLSAAAFV